MDDGDADACDGADVEIRIKLPTGMVMHTYISPKDTLLDARQILSECIESCYITCYELIRANGTAMSNFDVFGDVAKGELFTVRFRKYDEKDMRFHVAHLQELLMARLDDVMVSVYPTFPYDDPDGQTQKAYPSISRILGPNLKAIADTDSDSSFQAAVHTVDYALDPTCEHATGFTFSKEKKIAEQIYMKRTQHQELPPLGNFACAEDFDKEVTLDGVYDMLDQVPPVKHAVVPQISLQWNGFNPPPRHRKLQGDLGYVDVQFVGGHTSQVTCTPSGFYVNQSKSKADFSPGPAAKPHHSETLLGLLFTLNPKFREKACDLIRTRASIHPFETGPLAMPSLSNWMEHPESRVLPTGLISARCGEGSPAVLDHHTPVRSWNDEFQKAHDMPVDTYARRLEREKALARLHTEFLDFSMRAGVTAADGQMAPINPQEHPSSWVYLINNIFISQALDTRKV
ncbi:Clustered mitochondria protein-like protein, partial [Diplonema papillatum]